MKREAERRRMIRDIEAGVTETRHLIGRQRLDPRVMEAMRSVPREQFVPPDWRMSAFCDTALPIGHGQTISQPYIVALMSDLAGVGERDRVLEVGTGSGYQAAVLSLLAARVYSIERIESLAEAARRRLFELDYANVELRCGDGNAGWPEAAPFDAILVTAAAPRVPEALVQQLAPGGRLVIPVGPAGRRQQLVLLTRPDKGPVKVRKLVPVAFVPMVGAPGSPGSKDGDDRSGVATQGANPGD